jgi:hypothetical protein
LFSPTTLCRDFVTELGKYVGKNLMLGHGVVNDVMQIVGNWVQHRKPRVGAAHVGHDVPALWAPKGA